MHLLSGVCVLYILCVAGNTIRPAEFLEENKKLVVCIFVSPGAVAVRKYIFKSRLRESVPLP